MTNEEKYKTPQERDRAFVRFCTERGCKECQCRRGGANCHYVWLALEAEEEKPLPCPFCGGEAEIDSAIHFGSYYYFVKCKICHMSSMSCLIKDEAIAAWNRRVK